MSSLGNFSAISAPRSQLPLAARDLSQLQQQVCALLLLLLLLLLLAAAAVMLIKLAIVFAMHCAAPILHLCAAITGCLDAFDAGKCHRIFI
jgi:uncharacterized integral membrane protein